MKNILRVIHADFKAVRSNVVAIVIIFGLAVLPCLYAWFNIMSNWDPYGPESTENLKIAVYSCDAGAQIAGKEINIGNNVVSGLESNKVMGWVFCDSQEDAIEGVYASDYYAAIIIPVDFTQNMVSFLQGDVTHPGIIYYENEKKNAIAPKITAKAQKAVKESVNSAFISTLGETLFQVSGSLTMEAESTDAIGSVVEKLEQLDQDMEVYCSIIESFAAVADSSGNLMDTVDDVLPDVENVTGYSRNTVTYMQDVLKLVDTITAENDLSGKIATEIDSTQGAAEDLAIGAEAASQAGEELAGQAKEEAQAAGNDLSALPNEAAGAIENQASEVESEVNQIDQNVQDVLNYGVIELIEPDGDYLTLGAEEVTEDSPSQQESVGFGAEEVIESDSEEETTQNSDTKDTSENGFGAEEAGGSIGGDEASDWDEEKAARDQGASTDPSKGQQVKNSMDQLYDSGMNKANTALSDALAALDRIDSDYSSLTTSVENFRDSLDETTESLLETAADARALQAEIEKLHDDLLTFMDTEEYDKLKKIFTSNPELLSDFLSSPVNLVTEEVYPVENYGSAMAPFYTVLALWVGSLILVPVIHVKVSYHELSDIKPWQAFFGRYAIFFLIAETQALITTLGDLFYIGIQCTSYFYFWLGCAISSFAFSFFIYSLTVAFGNVGEAAAVVIMVIQVAGAGGSFPKEVLPEVFQAVYRFLPFAYSMNGLRECVAGIYENAFWKDMQALFILVGISLVIGLLLAIPMRKLMEMIEESKEETEVMI